MSERRQLPYIPRPARRRPTGEVRGGEAPSEGKVPVVAAIHIAPGARLPMKTVSSVLAEEGKGLVGDRYHGTRHRHVTVQSLESLAAASEALGQPIEPGMTRRNVTLDGGIVPSQSGKRIRIGPVELEVVRIAAPCRLLDDGIGPGAARALHQRAGSVCRVLRGGEIRVGDTMSTSAE